MYLFCRIASQHPDVHKRYCEGKIKTIRAAAVEAGIVHVPHPEDAKLERLLDTWAKSDLETRQLFLGFVEREIDAAYDGQLLNEVPIPRRGPRAYQPNTTIPEIEQLEGAGTSLSDMARKIGVTYRTVCSWRSGKTKIGNVHLEKIRGLLSGQAAPAKRKRKK
jgi:hypothetical protein